MAIPEGAGVWLDGEVRAPGDAFVSVFDRSFTVGDGVFETCLVLRDVPFALSRHLARLRRSAGLLGIVVPWSDDELRAACAEAIAAASDPRGVSVVRITASAGAGPSGLLRPDPPASTVVVVAAPAETRPAQTDVITIPNVRNERALATGIKATSYADNVLAGLRALDAGASEAVLGNVSGDLCEGTGTNVFLGHEGRLFTPPLSSGCLAGVTRDLVLDLVDVDVEPIPLEGLVRADEAFLTSTTRRVQAIAHVDGVALPTCPGPLTRAAVEAWATLEADELDP
jgi:branched-chain amino acid aminotransferase